MISEGCFFTSSLVNGKISLTSSGGGSSFLGWKQNMAEKGEKDKKGRTGSERTQHEKKS